MDVEALLEWYERVRRPLRGVRRATRYALLVSEVMLQQTQALRSGAIPRAVAVAVPFGGVCWPRLRCETSWGVERARVQPAGGAPTSGGGRGGGRLAGRLTSLPGGAVHRGRGVVVAWDVRSRRRRTNVRRVLATGGLASTWPPVRRVAPGGPRGDVQPGDDGTRRNGLRRSAGLRPVPGLERLRARDRGPCGLAIARVLRTLIGGRGRIVAALLAGDALGPRGSA